MYNLLQTHQNLLISMLKLINFECSLIMVALRLVYQVRNFVKLKKIRKSEKNTEVGGWVKPQLGFFFCVVFFVVHVLKKKKIG